MQKPLLKKYEHLRSIVKDGGRVAIAFSGGTDSSLLLSVAADVLGGRAVGIMAGSVLQTAHEVREAVRFAGRLGIQLEQVDLNPLSWPNFSENSRDRCYICKKNMYASFLAAIPAGVGLMDGTNIDDLSADRPGLRAIRELLVRTPLVEAGLGKFEVRKLSKELGLVTWNLPSSSCLATRISRGSKITLEKLALVEKGERYLVSLGFSGCRTRLVGNGVVISFIKGDFNRLVSDEMRFDIRNFFENLNLPKVFLDLSERQGIVPSSSDSLDI